MSKIFSLCLLCGFITSYAPKTSCKGDSKSTTSTSKGTTKSSSTTSQSKSTTKSTTSSDSSSTSGDGALVGGSLDLVSKLNILQRRPSHCGGLVFSK